MTELNIDSLDLSDELKTALKARETQLAQREQELAELRKTARATEIESRVSELKTLGLEQHPGLLKYVKEVYESDDGGSALNLSQDGKTEAKTASEILDGFIALLPTKDDKIALSAQVAESDKDEKPAENTDKELSLEDRAKQAREFLGLADPTKK